MFYVVLLDSDPNAKKCSIGLVAQAMYGDGITLYRCHLEKNHKGPHEDVTGCGNTKRAVHVRVQWCVGRNILSSVNWETGEEQ